ncbi:hypothetical protein LTR08_004056 [Meristemomyces frigidus]|nr:hypothetical protein LTR08_004056 [Meristemomyces frigidus]
MSNGTNNSSPALPALLREWMDGEHFFDVTPTSSSPFLHSSRFTDNDLRHALIYARDALEAAIVSLANAMKLADASYRGRIDIEGVRSKWNAWNGLGPGTLKERRWHGVQGERALFSGTLTDGSMLRRTITACCRMIVKVEQDDKVLRRKILWEQDEGKGPDKPLQLL